MVSATNACHPLTIFPLFCITSKAAVVSSNIQSVDVHLGVNFYGLCLIHSHKSIDFEYGREECMSNCFCFLKVVKINSWKFIFVVKLWKSENGGSTLNIRTFYLVVISSLSALPYLWVAFTGLIPRPPTLSMGGITDGLFVYIQY